RHGQSRKYFPTNTNREGIMKTPKNGWVNATQDDIQRQAADSIARHHKMRAQSLYEAFNKLGIYLPDVGHKLTGRNTMAANEALMELLFTGNGDSIKRLIA